MPIPEGGRCLGLGRRASYEAAHRYLDSGGAEGLPVIRVGERKLVVPVAQLRRLLGLPVTPTRAEDPAGGEALAESAPNRQEGMDQLEPT